MDTTALLTLLQVSDGLLPIGGAAHSYGLETLSQEGQIAAGDWPHTFSTYLTQVLGKGDLIAVLLAWRAGSAWNEHGDSATALHELLTLDTHLTAFKSAAELREASVRLGRRLLSLAPAWNLTGLVSQYATMVEAGQATGHHAPVFGLIAAAVGVSAEATGSAYCYSSLAGSIGAAQRLQPLGQVAAQRILYSLHPLIKEVVSQAKQATLEDMATASPGWELAAFRHSRLYSRLFMS